MASPETASSGRKFATTTSPRVGERLSQISGADIKENSEADHTDVTRSSIPSDSSQVPETLENNRIIFHDLRGLHDRENRLDYPILIAWAQNEGGGPLLRLILSLDTGSDYNYIAWSMARRILAGRPGYTMESNFRTATGEPGTSDTGVDIRLQLRKLEMNFLAKCVVVGKPGETMPYDISLGKSCIIYLRLLNPGHPELAIWERNWENAPTGRASSSNR